MKRNLLKENLTVAERDRIRFEERAERLKHPKISKKRIARPAAEISKPFDKKIKPFDKISKPFDKISKPFENISKPFEENSKPFEKTK
jgi:hypothetical protein